MKITIEEFSPGRHDIFDTKTLLAMAAGQPTIDKLAYLVDEFYTCAGRTLFVATNKGKTVGIIGIEYINRPRGFITHLAVSSTARKKGIARKLIEHTARLMELSEVETETDQDAVEFYRTCGFDTNEIESLYNGIRRYRCLKTTLGIAVLK